MTCDTSHFEISPLKDLVLPNNPCMLVTRDTFHFERSPWKLVLPKNSELMSVTSDTSQSPIGPYRSFVQAPSGDASRHISTALWSSKLDGGENAAVERTGIRAVRVVQIGEGGWKNELRMSFCSLTATKDCG